MEQGIKSLMEMGIPIDVATDAMQRTNGNLESAVNFIFSNELPNDQLNDNNNNNENIPPPPSSAPTLQSNNPFRSDNNEHIQLTDNNSQLRPGDLTHIIDNRNNNNNTPVSENEVENIQIDPSSSPSLSSTTTTNSNDEDGPPDYNTMRQPLHKLDILNPTIILPLPPNSLIENYLALFAWAVAKYIPKWFLIPDFKDLNYDSNWYKGVSLNEPVCKVLQDGSIMENSKITNENLISDIQPETLWQLQKLISVINNSNSKRGYVSPNIFSLVFDNDLRLQMQDTDRINELLPGFIKSLLMDLEICARTDKTEVNKTFITNALYKPGDSNATTESNVMLFHFPPEEYDTNLYKMLNNLLYPSDSDLIENEDGKWDFQDITGNSLKDISPFLTIIFNEMDEMTEEDIALPEGVDIPFEFYPQLYNVATKNQLIKHIIIKRKQAEQKLKKCLYKMQALKNFQGKNISNVLESSINYMNKDNNDKHTKYIKSLKSIHDGISNKLKALKEEYQDLTGKIQKEWNLSHPDYHIIESAKKMGLIDEPHLLIMVTLSPYSYFIRDKKDMSKWSLMQSNAYGTDYQIVNDIDETKVKETIMKFTTRPNETPIMFNYCKANCINSDEDIMEWIQSNEGCEKFMKSDEIWIKENTIEEDNDDNISLESNLIDD